MRHESSCFCIILPRADLNEDQNEDQNEELRNRNGHGWNRTWIGSRERFSGRGLSWSFFDHILSGAVEKQAALSGLPALSGRGLRRDDTGTAWGDEDFVQARRPGLMLEEQPEERSGGSRCTAPEQR